MMSDYKVAHQEWSTVDIAKLASEGVKTLTIESENLFLDLPIIFFTESGTHALENSIGQDSLLPILHRLEDIHRIQAEFTGFALPAKVYIKVGTYEEMNGINSGALPFGQKQVEAFIEDLPWLLGQEMALVLDVNTPNQLLNLTNFNDQEQNKNALSIVAREFGHIFEMRASNTLYTSSFNEAWDNILGLYTCEKLNVPFKTAQHQLSPTEITNHMNTGNAASVESPYSPYARAILMEIKDVAGGWDVLKAFFHGIVEKPCPQKSRSEETSTMDVEESCPQESRSESPWLWMRDVIKEKSNIDIAPILTKYHVPLPSEIVEVPHVALTAQGEENLLVAGTLSSAPRNYTLRGNDGHTVMYGSPYNDMYYGGSGQDELRFIDNKRGQDTFFNFDPLKDRISISFSQGQAPTTEQIGNNFVFSFANGDSLTLDSVHRSQLKKENFTFLEVPEENLNYNIYSFIMPEYHNLKNARLWHVAYEDANMIPVPTLNFEHTMSYARQSGAHVIFDCDEKNILAITNFENPEGVKLSDFKETDFRYKKSVPVSLDIGLNNEDTLFQPPSVGDAHGDNVNDSLLLGEELIESLGISFTDYDLWV